MNILVPTDFSAAADRAIAQALAIRGQMGGSVAVCHVVESSDVLISGYFASGPNGYAVPTSQEIAADVRVRAVVKERQAGLRLQLLQRLTNTAPLADRHDLLVGEATETIKLAASDKDLLIMSPGETARHLLWQLPCPLLCFPHEAAPQPIRRIAVGIDFSKASRAALAWCSRLEAQGVELLLVTFGPGAKRAALTARLEALAGGRPTFVGSGRLDQAVAELARRFAVDAMAIGGKGRSALLESITRGTAGRLFARSELPFFVVRDSQVDRRSTRPSGEKRPGRAA